MAYISLYRKYRSQTFDDVIGQDHVVRTIRNAIRAGRIGQGYLFCGSRGTGKTTVARLIAKALNCMSGDGPTPDPCGKCEACVSIAEGNAVDVVEMDAASNRGVDDVDALRDGVKYPPMRLRYKVYIIDEAHQLSAHAKDAFLKTLEEPPPHAVFVLATTEAGKIPITIRSRCQQFDFRRGSTDEIGGRLWHVVEGEGATIDDDAIDLIARAANGSYRDSLSVLEQVMAYTENSVTVQDVYTVLGAVDEDLLLEMGDVLSTTDTAAAFDMADRLLREGKDVRELLKSAANHFRDILTLKVGADHRKQNDDRWRRQAESFTQDRLIRIIDIFSAAEKDLKWNEQHRLGLEMALLRAMARPKEAPVAVSVVAPASPRSVEPKPTASAPREEKKKPEPVPEPVTTPEPPSPELPNEEPAEINDDGRGINPPTNVPINPPTDMSLPASEAEPESEEPPQAGGASISLSELQRNWQKIIMHLQKVLRQTSVAALAREGRPVDISGAVLTVGFSKKHGFHQKGVEQNLDKVSQAIEAVMNVRLKVITSTLDGELPGAPQPERALEKAESEPVQHPLMNDVLTMFDGTIVQDDNNPWED
ncbi:MAG: DNA polymerase III subunit gamma/tau [Armatimonadetes bacterium]|nr:DNA polymerase III subunit gamma/tau [Armatimonadota bacterium]